MPIFLVFFIKILYIYQKESKYGVSERKCDKYRDLTA